MFFWSSGALELEIKRRGHQRTACLIFGFWKSGSLKGMILGFHWGGGWRTVFAELEAITGEKRENRIGLRGSVIGRPVKSPWCALQPWKQRWDSPRTSAHWEGSSAFPGIQEALTRRKDNKNDGRASLVAQRLSFCLPMQEIRVWSLIWEDSTCLRATKPMCYNCRARALEPGNHSCDCWAHVPQLLRPVCPGGACSAAGEATAVRSRSAAAGEEPHSLQLEKSPGSNKDPTQPIINKHNY